MGVCSLFRRYCLLCAAVLACVVGGDTRAVMAQDSAPKPPVIKPLTQGGLQGLLKGLDSSTLKDETKAMVKKLASLEESVGKIWLG